MTKPVVVSRGGCGADCGGACADAIDATANTLNPSATLQIVDVVVTELGLVGGYIRRGPAVNRYGVRRVEQYLRAHYATPLRFLRGRVKKAKHSGPDKCRKRHKKV